jgi:2-methylcitrate dehydratase PrpD
MTLTTRLADYFSALTYDALPAAVVEKAKENVIDTLAGAIPGATLPDVAGITAALKSYDRQADCTLWGSGERASALTAALVNGTSAHALEMDDFHPQGKCHMGVVVVPAVLALGEAHRISGRQLLLAVATGYEVGLRVAIAVGTASHRLRGWHATSSCGVFGAAAGACKVLYLDAERMVSALGLAGTQSSGLWAFMQDGAGNKKFHGGHAAHAGAVAAILAQGGLTGPSAILEAEDGGFFRATSDDFNCATVVEGLGERWHLLRVGRKPYACCRSMHLSIDGIFELKREHGLRPEEIENVEVLTYEIGVKQCGTFQVPQNRFEATFSIPYGIAVTLFDDAAGVCQFTEERLRDPRIAELCRKIEVRSSEKYTSHYPVNWGCEINVRTRDGRMLNKVIWNGKGGPDNPMSRDDLTLKFKSLAGQVMDEARMERIVATVYGLDNVADVTQLASLLAP